MADGRRTKRRFDTNSPAPIRDRDPWPRQPEDGPIPLFDHFEDTRKAAKSSECRNRAIENAWDDYNTPEAQPRHYTVQRPSGAQPHQPEDALPPFPPIPDMSTRPEGYFQHVVVDALTAFWARVSRCRCSSRRSVPASSPSAAEPSRHRRGTSSNETSD
ncbi:hypothetical protein F2Q69_00006035 [Brassica cretica]|uniref:Uncharacterized protein n=1 Tax=Brassica cretica TaxID=69181 RepID=A0A8S9P5P3_BRACR|nr:hypothetical protein F2Q69_00006035 [Brassica cretica]